MAKDIRWQQRFSNFQKALAKLKKLSEKDNKSLTTLEKEGFIHRFEYTHELAWNTMKDFLFYSGVNKKLIGSQGTTREAFAAGLIEDGDIWMEMISSRNLTSHTYNEETAEEIFVKIEKDFLPCFLKFERIMIKFKNDNE